jgi:hypothetical protein
VPLLTSFKIICDRIQPLMALGHFVGGESQCKPLEQPLSSPPWGLSNVEQRRFERRLLARLRHSAHFSLDFPMSRAFSSIGALRDATIIPLRISHTAVLIGFMLTDLVRLIHLRRQERRRLRDLRDTLTQCSQLKCPSLAHILYLTS